MKYQAQHLKVEETTVLHPALAGGAARFVVAAGLAGALVAAAPAVALAGTTDGTAAEAGVDNELSAESVSTNKGTSEQGGTEQGGIDKGTSEQGGTEQGGTEQGGGQDEKGGQSGQDETKKVETPETPETPEPELTPQSTPEATEPAPAKGHWVVDARTGRLERYWYGADGQLAKGKLVTPEEGAGYYAWAMADGRILRGKWDNGAGRVYVADNDGKLIGSDYDQDAWVVTAKYDGHLERYRVDAQTKAAKSGFFEVEGYGDVFGRGGQGYVVRGAMNFGGRRWYADNDGRLASGWLVTDKFGQGLQRYWMGDEAFDSRHAMAAGRTVSADEGAGYYARALDDGRILRGKWDSGRGRVFVADNDGVLLGSDMAQDGWVVTGKYDGHLERYYVDAAQKAAKSGFFTVEGYGDVFGRGGQGYVVRGALPFGGSVVLADNDGRLPTASGWLVTDKYFQGLQRYWVEKIWGDYLGTKPGYSTGGWEHVTTSAGYVLRNGMQPANGKAYIADNDGRVKETQFGWYQDGAGNWWYATGTGMADFDYDLLENGVNTGNYNVAHRAWELAQGQSSPTDMLVLMDYWNCYVTVFKGSQGNWSPIKGWNCNNGSDRVAGGNCIKSGSWLQGTFRGEEGKGRPLPERTTLHHTEWYYTNIMGGFAFHSSYGERLGVHVSHNCIRLQRNNAKWIYDNLKHASRVTVY